MNPANRPAMKVSVLRIFVIFFLPFVPALVSAQGDGFVSGKIVSAENNGAIPYATVFLKETRYGASTDTSGLYGFKAPAGDYSLVVSAIGYERIEKPVRLTPGSRTKISLALTPKTTEMEEVVVLGSGVGRVNKSSFYAPTRGLAEVDLRFVRVEGTVGIGSVEKPSSAVFVGHDIDGSAQSVGPETDGNHAFVNFDPFCEVYRNIVQPE